MITLYYIENISRFDEPYFDFPSSQITFFADHVVQSIDAGFYPPHYRNRITLDTVDVDFTTQCNYLSLEFGGKTYYYYIDDINYISEDVVELVVTMDVIQTYMFNISCKNAHINRHTIARWNGNIINRDYIRENLSQGEKIIKSYTKTHDDIIWLVVWFRSAGGKYKASPNAADTITMPDNFSQFNGYFVTHVGMTPFFVPVNSSQGSPYKIVDQLGNTYDCPYPTDLLEEPTVEHIDYINHDVFKGFYTYNSSTKTLTFNSGSGVIGTDLYNGTKYLGSGILQKTNMFMPDENTKITILDFTKNNKKGVARSNKFIPALLDDNYYTLYYGEQMNQGTYPLYQLQTSDLYKSFRYDIISGNRIYFISPTNQFDVAIKDPFLVITVCNSAEVVDLYTDAWKQYQASHIATLTDGLKLNYLNTAVRGVTNAVTSKMQAVTGALTGHVGTAVGGATGDIRAKVDTALGFYNIAKNYQITKENLQYTPDTSKQGNSITSDLIVGSLDEVTILYEVKDIYAVAFKYETLGYAVNQDFTGSNIFKAYNTRYYYNVISADINAMTLIGIVTDETTIGLIKDRFSAGLRLWNTDSGKLRAETLCDFRYDNVETSFITEG